MKESRKESALRRLLEDPSPYTTETTIRIALGYKPDSAKKVFDTCKTIELEKYPLDPTDEKGERKIDPRPNEIMKSTLFKVMNINYGLMLKQHRAAKELKKAPTYDRESQ